MKHLKKFEDRKVHENIDAFIEAGGTEDEYLESPEYFDETFINGNYSQLHNMLNKFRSQGRMEEVVNYLKEVGNRLDCKKLIKNEILKTI